MQAKGLLFAVWHAAFAVRIKIVMAAQKIIVRTEGTAKTTIAVNQKICTAVGNAAIFHVTAQC